MAISFRYVLDAQKLDTFCTEILSGNGHATKQFIESDEVVLLRIVPGAFDALQKHLYPNGFYRAFNLVHKAKLA